MTLLALYRHTRTAWNEAGRLQGRADIPALDSALAKLQQQKLPAPYDAWPWFTSPLIRTRQTAKALGLEPAPDAALIETHWGEYEGKTLDDLSHLGDFLENESRGLDLQPPNGESPRQVQDRLKPWLRARAEAGVNCGAMSHKGVIRAILALAYDWPMLGKPPVKLDWTCLHVFRLEADGLPRPEQMNIPLVPR
ncbi:histidine phosphatase family protein [Ferrovibrio sp. MS7]|jgi:broad specificity phosphatase PhoE|uniref:histidine phosphatase family protein n=1 Tax=Ferrovibrio plantarum TaxID=3119164 RepID=UPI001B7A68C8|nr:histidine phosphatase family protein [Ferrovibrio sp.]